jgi:hypothetical protein
MIAREFPSRKPIGCSADRSDYLREMRKRSFLFHFSVFILAELPFPFRYETEATSFMPPAQSPIEVSPDEAQMLLGLYENERKTLLDELKKKQTECERLDAKIANLKNKINGKKTESAHSSSASFVKTPKGRAPRGASRQAILEFLDSNKGNKYTLSQVAEKTGTTISSARRALDRLIASGVIGHSGKTYSGI